MVPLCSKFNQDQCSDLSTDSFLEVRAKKAVHSMINVKSDKDLNTKNIFPNYSTIQTSFTLPEFGVDIADSSDKVETRF
jgi:hypothetical protein